MKKNVGLHVGIIADGNRRWAKSHGVSVLKGHATGLNKVVKKILLPLIAKRKEVSEISIYLFSTENFNRSEKEKNGLWKIFAEYEKAFENKDNFIIRHVGRKDRLPKFVLKGLIVLERKTKNNDGQIINLCIDYSSSWEIDQAVEKGGNDYKNYFILSPFDLVIRTSGEKRLSNFAQRPIDGYAELYFTKTMFPAMTALKFKSALMEFAKRKIRKGQ